MISNTKPTPEETLALFKEIEQKFPSQTLGEDKWYILLIAAITTGGHPGLAADLYKYLISKPEFSTPEQRKALVRRLREALVKLVSVVGVVKPLEAIFCIAGVERPEDRDDSFSRETWSSGPSNRQRGREWLDKIYRSNHTATENTLACHKDFEWLSIEISYGLYLSDHSILGPVETEIIVLSGILMQNAARESAWHLRGTRRIGVSSEDVETIQQCIEKVADFCGWKLDKIPRVKDIEHEVPWESGA
ncbi:uncharacterized protein MYCFIDRAFT_202985 [Pseudocercospora fijiensis CIRAD86]|uniref:Carboxymuconolactone decarboxylase-like domain-containing protein n=1 Tax=Pseudocercospora fijiensis (strain CIRAD86) TaxID=383855 RepID=M2ZZL3_PSEFD|nr:uncharacterized protein MYCFIDRAFT_202985 [Pseudocercospora fijiensis CIRAD86]EME84349.1 hypothetical protein MYCFIDRAFT_202985 [Pseudocercospora fijiensis CIRAD86]